jgi:hypothetical protein
MYEITSVMQEMFMQIIAAMDIVPSCEALQPA